MSFSPKVSVVIPVYNGSKYVREAIDSALAQTYQNIEIIVVNDGSNDNGRTEEIALSYEDRIRYFFKENGGVASALNFGIKEMSGDYLSWLSHDDVYYPYKIERQVVFLETSKEDNVVLYSDFELIDESSYSIGSYRVPSTLSTNPFLSILSTNIHGCSTLISRNLLAHVGPFNEKLKTTQDNDMWLRIYKAGYAFRHLPEILIKSRCHPDQGQILLSAVNKIETYQFYRRVFDVAYDSIARNADKVLDVLVQKNINLPLSFIRQSRLGGENIPLVKLVKYKSHVLLRLGISKLRLVQSS